ncbi:MAG: flavin reductase family protein [Bacteroidales bacterium]|nr:flavin reductase family protein [Bacteroidales bacterium]MBR6903736.1 flavin reductase family protein [Bacteroidales bacterium]
MAKIRKRTLRGGNMLNPTPVVMVSCGSTLDEYNIITVAWAGTVNSDPPVCAVSIRPERHSYGIIKQSGAFVINLVDKRLTPYADWCGVRSGRKYNKFVETGLTPVRATMVNAPMIEESPVNLECKVTQVIPLGSHDLFLAEVVAVHVNEKLFSPKTDAIDLKRANLVAYSHGHYYTLGEIIGKFGFSVEKKRSQS